MGKGKTIFHYILWCFCCLDSVTVALWSTLPPHLHPNWTRPFWNKAIKKKLILLSPWNLTLPTAPSRNGYYGFWLKCHGRRVGTRCIQLVLWLLMHDEVAEPCVSICLPIYLGRLLLQLLFFLYQYFQFSLKTLFFTTFRWGYLIILTWIKECQTSSESVWL